MKFYFSTSGRVNKIYAEEFRDSKQEVYEVTLGINEIEKLKIQFKNLYSYCEFKNRVEIGKNINIKGEYWPPSECKTLEEIERGCQVSTIEVLDENGEIIDELKPNMSEE